MCYSLRSYTAVGTEDSALDAWDAGKMALSDTKVRTWFKLFRLLVRVPVLKSNCLGLMKHWEAFFLFGLISF
jgi:hypothetical protein